MVLLCSRYGQNNVTEPIWATNQRAGEGRRSAAEWIGGGVTFNNQSIDYIPFEWGRDYYALVDQFIALYTREENPINFGALYFDEPGKKEVDLVNLVS